MPKNVMCKNCNNYRNDWCEMVLDSPDPDIVRDCRHFWLKTNADRIRAMTDEELADWISNFVYEIGSGEVAYSDDTDQWLFWLQQPCKGE